MFLLTIAHMDRGPIWTAGPKWTGGPIRTGVPHGQGVPCGLKKIFAIKVEQVFEGDMGDILGHTSPG